MFIKSLEIGSNDLKYEPSDNDPPKFKFNNELLFFDEIDDEDDDEPNDDEIDEVIEFLKMVYKLLSYEF